MGNALIAPLIDDATQQLLRRAMLAPAPGQPAATPPLLSPVNAPKPAAQAPAQPSPQAMLAPVASATSTQPQSQPMLAPVTPAAPPVSDEENAARSLGMLASDQNAGKSRYGGPTMLDPVGTQPAAAAQPDYTKRYQDWEASRPTLDPNAGKPSVLRRILGGVSAGLVGFRNPEEGARLGEEVVNAPRLAAERDFAAREKQWEELEKPEQAEAAGELRGELQAQRDEAANRRTQELIAGRAANVATQEAGKNQRQTQVVASREDIAKMEADNRAAIAAGKPQPHITVLGPDGKSHIMERDPQSGAYTVDRGEAPPTYAQIAPSLMQTRTTEVLGPDNVMHRYAFNPSTMSFDIDVGAAPTGAAAHQIFQAQTIENLVPQIVSDINANRKILGNLGSYYKQWLSGTPVADPTAGQMMAELMSLAAMQPALHAFRSASALDAFEKMIGGLAKNPDATIATINGLLKTPEAFTNTVRNPRAAPGGGAGAGGSKVYRYDKNGNRTP